MDRQVADSAVSSGDPQSLAGDALFVSGGDAASIQRKDGAGTPGATGKSLKQALINLIPPFFLVMICLFWYFLPARVVEYPATVVAVGLIISFSVLGLEQVFERHAGWRLNKVEFFTDLFYVVLSYTVIAWATNILAEEPLKAIKTSLGITTGWVSDLPFIVQAAMVVFLIEFGQYWMHRLMHNSTPFWLTHAPHHHITQLNAMKGAVGNPIELFLISLSVVALFDFDTAAIFCGINILGVISTFAHANVRADPPLFYSFFFTTIRHHSLHHSVGYEETRCNYANSLILMDRVFGTYREGEGILVGQDDRRRLSIREQFLFPFGPLIDAIRARRGKSQSAKSQSVLN